MDNRETSVENVVFEYTGDGCSVPNDIASVIFKEGLQKIGDHAFYTCTSLKSITLPSTLVEIGNAAFYNCTSLKSVTLPSTVTEIGENAFRNCYNLREVILNNGLQKIRDSAFCSCTSLESITLPSTVTEISDEAFCDCYNLREVELNGVPPYVKSAAFLDCNALERFLFPTISYRLENIIQTKHWEDIEDKVNQVRGVVQWESKKLFVSGATHQNWNIWNIIRRDFGRITRLVLYYELKESTSTFELALWKFNLDQAGTTNTTNRAAYRIDVPGPVKDTMLQYLDHTC